MAMRDAVDYYAAYQHWFSSVRAGDLAGLVEARQAFYPLYFALNHSKYARIIADDTAHVLYHMDNEQYTSVRSGATFVSLSGLPDRHQGCDAIQEEMNRMMLQFLTTKCDVSLIIYLIFLTPIPAGRSLVPS